MNFLQKNRKATRDMVFIAMFAVMMAVCAWISIPGPVPFTMQTFAVFLALNYLGAKKGLVSILLYLTMGAIGLPVFAGFHGGIERLLGMTGGYMLGWILSGLVMWLFERLSGRRLWVQAVAMLTGLLVCYGAGTAWFVVVYSKVNAPIGILSALLMCVIPFIVPDCLKLALALWLSRRLEKITATGRYTEGADRDAP